MKRALYLLLVVFVVAQFIRPDTAPPEREPAQDLIAVTHASTEMAVILRTACYDCHSSETTYPWYVNITPVNWWMQHHVNEGREEINFSNWSSLSEKKRRHSAKEAVELIEAGEMPLTEYTWTHPKARLDEVQKKRLLELFESLR